MTKGIEARLADLEATNRILRIACAASALLAVVSLAVALRPARPPTEMVIGEVGKDRLLLTSTSIELDSPARGATRLMAGALDVTGPGGMSVELRAGEVASLRAGRFGESAAKTAGGALMWFAGPSAARLHVSSGPATLSFETSADTGSRADVSALDASGRIVGVTLKASRETVGGHVSASSGIADFATR